METCIIERHMVHIKMTIQSKVEKIYKIKNKNKVKNKLKNKT